MQHSSTLYTKFNLLSIARSDIAECFGRIYTNSNGPIEYYVQQLPFSGDIAKFDSYDKAMAEFACINEVPDHA